VQVGVNAEDGALLNIETGRPPVELILSDAVAAHHDLPSIGVFVSMGEEVKLTCSRLNDSWKVPYLDCSSHAFEL